MSPKHVIVDWLTAKLKERGHGARKALAQFLGVRPAAITGMTNAHPDKETRDITAAELLKMAEFFGEPPPIAMRARSNLVPIMGYIGAGAEIDPSVEQIPPEGLSQVELPFSMPDEMIGFEVAGDSMLPVYDAGDVVVCFHRQRRPIEFFLGREAAVRTSDGKRYLKRISKGATRGRFNLNSWNARAILNVKIEWIGEIVATVSAEGIRRVPKRGRKGR